MGHLPCAYIACDISYQPLLFHLIGTEVFHSCDIEMLFSCLDSKSVLFLFHSKAQRSGALIPLSVVGLSYLPINFSSLALHCHPPLPIIIGVLLAVSFFRLPHSWSTERGCHSNLPVIKHFLYILFWFLLLPVT